MNGLSINSFILITAGRRLLNYRIIGKNIKRIIPGRNLLIIFPVFIFTFN